MIGISLALILTLVAVCAALLALIAAPAFAAVNFHYANASTDKSGNLLVSFKKTGLAKTASSEFVQVNADASAEYGCFNRDGNHPEAANKETVSGPVVGSGTFPVRNGQTTETITVAPPSAGAFSCPKGQELRLISVSYSNITITETAGTISTAPSTVSFPNTYLADSIV